MGCGVCESSTDGESMDVWKRREEVAVRAGRRARAGQVGAADLTRQARRTAATKPPRPPRPSAPALFFYRCAEPLPLSSLTPPVPTTTSPRSDPSSALSS